MNASDAAPRYLAPFALGTVLATAVNLLSLRALAALYPNASVAYLRVCVNPALGALQEPLTSKLLPAVVVLLWAAGERRTAALRAGRYRLAAAGGATVGLLEAASKAVDAGALAPAVLLPVALHAGTGLLVGASVYRLAGRERTPADAALVVAACAWAVALHAVWNLEVAFWLAGFDPC